MGSTSPAVLTMTPPAIPATVDDVFARLAAALAPAPELVDRAGLAAMLGVSEATVDRLRSGGKIGPRVIRFGGVKYLREEVAAWVRHPAPNGELLEPGPWSRVWAEIERRRK